MRSYLYDRLVSGVYKPHVDRTFAFAQVADAYRYLESNEQVGKVVINFLQSSKESGSNSFMNENCVDVMTNKCLVKIEVPDS